MIEQGQVVDLDVVKPTAGGRMLARHEGQVVLVWGAIPGERVRARVERVAKGVVFADVVDVLTSSADRRALAGDWRCGGTVLAHVAYPRQLQLKAAIVQDAFTRIARVPLGRAPVIAESPEQGYRMRARLHAQGARLGFFREGTHELCDARRTGQLLPATGEWIARAEALLARDGSNGLAGVEIAENIQGDLRAGHLELHGAADPARFSSLGEGLAGLSAQRADAATSVCLAGTPAVVDEVRVGEAGPALRLRRDVRAFFQGNRFLLERFMRDVIARVPEGPVVDLYAGVGLFGLALAALGRGDIALVEGDVVSGADLARNAEPYVDRVRVERRSVEDYLRRARMLQGVTVIVDPPRTGMSRDAVGALIAAAPSAVVYVSCDVATLARDTRALIDAGYELGEVSGFDLFPNTAHVESLAVFRR
jgi:tRNA/tmRNA/rRNA uracil-C5-methylase (TrmA/RlmC/RlmD family)